MTSGRSKSTSCILWMDSGLRVHIRDRSLHHAGYKILSTIITLIRSLWWHFSKTVLVLCLLPQVDSVKPHPHFQTSLFSNRKSMFWIPKNTPPLLFPCLSVCRSSLSLFAACACGSWPPGLGLTGVFLLCPQAEARLAAKRAARAEARDIRMRELERQQKEVFYTKRGGSFTFMEVWLPRPASLKINK